MTFQDVLKNYFQATHGLNIAAQWGSMQRRSPNIRTNTITLDLKQVSLRNLLRLVDGLPVLNILGVILISTSAERARFGDLIAGTRVVRGRPS